MKILGEKYKSEEATWVAWTYRELYQNWSTQVCHQHIQFYLSFCVVKPICNKFQLTYLLHDAESFLRS